MRCRIRDLIVRRLCHGVLLTELQSFVPMLLEGLEVRFALEQECRIRSKNLLLSNVSLRKNNLFG